MLTLDDINERRYYWAMIISYRDKRTERLHKGGRVKGFPAEIAKRARMRLDRIDAAIEVDDLRVPPSHMLEKLTGDRKGQWSIRVNKQWRICFDWKNGNALNVECTDYH